MMDGTRGTPPEAEVVLLFLHTCISVCVRTYTCVHPPQTNNPPHSFMFPSNTTAEPERLDFQFQDAHGSVLRLHLLLRPGEGLGSAETEARKAVKAHALQL